MSDQFNKKIDEILEVVTFIRDTAATKEELARDINAIDARFDSIDQQFDDANRRFDVIDARFIETERTIISHVDEFVGMHKKLDTELAALRFKYERMEEKMNSIMNHLQLS